MSRRKAYTVLFEGYADWEIGFILPEIKRSADYEVVTVGHKEHHVTSMGGLEVTTQITFNEMKIDQAGLLLLPGGDMWGDDSDERVPCAIKRFHEKQIPVAAICGATLAVARTGLLNTRRHTSNELDFIKKYAPDYRGDTLYQEERAVEDDGIITASGTGAVEFAYEIIRLLNIYPADAARQWLRLFREGEIPQT